jgi:DNA-directed RNA polymerase subunit RPC12/RpoP
MPFKAAKCPNCGGDLQVPDDRDSVKCMYCGSDIIVREAIKAASAGVNIENLFSLAKSAFDAGNFQEACDYYTKILEVDAGHYEAWMGKGFSAGWSSTLKDFRISETLSGIDKAIIAAPEDHKEAIREQGAISFMDLINEYYNMLDKFVRDSLADIHAPLVHPQHKADVRNLVGKTYYRVSAEIISVLGDSTLIFPMHLEIPKKLIDICVKSIHGYGTDVRCTDEYREVTRKMIDFYSDTITKMDGSYQKPEIKESGGCFIATATMGNANHPIVNLLREFRDTWLLERRYGKIFIKYYYKIGPYFAAIIKQNIFLRQLCFILIVKPAFCIATGLINKR